MTPPIWSPSTTYPRGAVVMYSGAYGTLPYQSRSDNNLGAPPDMSNSWSAQLPEWFPTRELRVFNVREPHGPTLGAKGNRSGDDYNAIQATHDAAGVWVAGAAWERAAVIYYPIGSYNIGHMPKVQSPNTLVIFEGPGNPKGSADANASPVSGGAVLYATASFTDPWLFEVARPTADYALAGVTIDGIGADGSALGGLGNTGGLHMQAFSSTVFRGIISRVPGKGAYEEAVGHVTTFPDGTFNNQWLGFTTDSTGDVGYHASAGATDSQHMACVHQFTGFYGAAGKAGMLLDGSGHQVIGCGMYNCSGPGIAGTTRAQVLSNNRVIDCNGGIYLHANVNDGGGYYIGGNQIRSCSVSGDGVWDGINITADEIIRGGTIAPNSFSTLQRNGPPNAMRYCIFTDANVRGSIDKQSYDWQAPATRCYVLGKINALGGMTQGLGVLAHSAVAVSHAGDIIDTILVTVVIPGMLLGPNGGLRVTATFSVTNNANTKTMRVKFAGNSYLNAGVTASSSYRAVVEIWNRNSQAVQIGGGPASGAEGAGGAAIPASAVDTTIDQNLTFNAFLGNAADTITLESYTVEVIEQ